MPNFLERVASGANKKRKQIQSAAVDLVDANTQDDQKRRLAADQARLYQDQQRQMGRTPISNPVQQIATQAVKPVAQFANTASLATRQGVEGARMATGLVTGNSTAALAASKRADTNYDRFANGNSGLLGQGSFLNNAEVAKRGAVKEIAPRIAGGTVSTAATVLPVARGSSLVAKGMAVKQALPRAAAEGAVYSGTGSAGSQLIETGKVDPVQTAKDAALGSVLGPAGYGVARGTRALIRPGPKPVTSPRPRINLDDQRALRDYSDYLSGANPARPGELNQVIPAARQAAQSQGSNLATGSQLDRLEATNRLLDNIGRPAQTQQVPNLLQRLQTGIRPLDENGGINNRPAAATRTQPLNRGGQPPASTTATQVTGMPPSKPPRSTAVAPSPDFNPSAPGPLGPQKTSSFAGRTVPNSEFVSDATKQKLNAPVYNVQSEKASYTSALDRLKNEGEDKFFQSSRQALDRKPGTISRQEAVDATTAAQLLDASQDPAALQRASEIYEKLSEHYTAAGQLSQAAAILSRRSPQGMVYQAEKTLREANVLLTPELRQQIRSLAANTQTAANKQRATYELSQLVQSQIPSSFAEKASNVWRAGLLTAPTTTAGNILGNSAEAAIRKGFVNPVASGADKLIGLVTGQRTQTLAPLGSGIEGARTGAGKLPDFLKTGFDERNSINKYDQKQVNFGPSKTGRVLNAYVNGTYRLMSTADQPYWYSAQKNALGSIAKAEAINQGIKGPARQKFINDFMANPPQAALERSTQEAAYATFQNKTGLGRAASAFKDGLNSIAPGLGDFIVPFTQVPASIATRVITRTPVGTAQEAVRQFLNVRRGGQFDQRALAQSIGEGAFGTAVLGTGYALANSGLLTFGYPKDQKERALWESEGKQPYSVKVGDRWYSLNYIQPFGTFLAIGAKAGEEITNGKSVEDAIAAAAGTAGQSIANQSFVKGVSGAIDAVTDPERSATKFINQTGSSLVPNFVRATARSFDDTQREPAGFVEGIKQGIPGLRQTTPEKVGAFGQPLPAKDNPANQLLNPLRPSIDRSGDQVLNEARRLQDSELGVLPSQINKSSLGKDQELNKDQVRQLQNNVGKAVNSQWQKLVKTDGYKVLSDEDKSKALKNLSKDVLAVEKRKFAAENGLAQPKGKLDSKQTALATGNEDINTYANIANGSTALPKNYNNLDDPVKKFYAQKAGESKEWLDKAVDNNGKDLIRRVNQIKPADMPELPNTNEVASLYADFVQKRDAEKWSKTRETNEKLNLLKKAYKTQLSEDDDYWLSGNDGQLRAAIDNGDITQERLDQLVAYDNLQSTLGGQAQIGKTLRRLLGLGDAPQAKYGNNKYSSSGGSRGGGGRKLKASAFESPLDILTKYSIKGANLAANASLGK